MRLHLKETHESIVQFFLCFHLKKKVGTHQCLDKKPKKPKKYPKLTSILILFPTCVATNIIRHPQRKLKEIGPHFMGERGWHNFSVRTVTDDNTREADKANIIGRNFFAVVFIQQPPKEKFQRKWRVQSNQLGSHLYCFCQELWSHSNHCLSDTQENCMNRISWKAHWPQLPHAQLAVHHCYALVVNINSKWVLQE